MAIQGTDVKYHVNEQGKVVPLYKENADYYGALRSVSARTVNTWATYFSWKSIPPLEDYKKNYEYYFTVPFLTACIL